WRQHLADLPALQLPTDHPRPANPTHQGAIHEFALPPALHARLAALSQQEGATLFMTLLTAFQMLLVRYCNQTDIVVGTAVANRTRAETEELIGFFVNQLVLRADLSGNPLFREALKRVREVCLSAYAHQDLPFEELVKALNPERRINQAPLFQVEIIYENTAMPTLALPGLAAQSLGDQLPMARFDLVLAFQEDAHRLSGTLVYSTELFEAATMTRLLGHYLTLLEGIADNPDRRLADLPLLTAAERRQLLVDWNATKTDLPPAQCAHQLFAAQALRTPDAIALVMDDHQVTYQTLDARANQLAHHLRSLGVGPEVRVGLCVERSLDLIVGLLGIMKAGGAYVPLDPAYPQERLAFMLADSQVPLVLTQEHLLAGLPASQARYVCFDQIEEQIAQEPATPPADMLYADNLAYVIYTSGSTGRPKGVLVTHRGLGNLVAAQVRAFDIRPDSRVLQFASISFDASVSEVLTALLTGATLVLATRDDLLPGTALLRLLREQAISVVTLPPSALAVLTDEAVPALRTLVVAGESCSPALAERWAAGRRFVNAYGPTEATVCATVAEAYTGGQHLTIGHPISNTQIYLLDQHLQPAPIGVPGEIYIAGVSLARGYLSRPDLTAERFIPSPFADMPGARLYRSGDWARYRADGNLEFLGRRDDQVKLRGFRIELGEVEAVLEQHAAVREAVVVVREDAPGDQRLVAYVVAENLEPRTQNLEPNTSQAGSLLDSKFLVLSSAELRQHLGSRLPSYMVPSTIVILEALPLTAHGKVDRRALPAPEITSAPADTFVAPRTPVEELLAESWAGVLRLHRVGIHDNFFDMGGHSLLATQVISRVRDLFQVELTLRSFLETPTIAKIAVTIENLILDELESLPDEELDRLIQA
ncbi:MAG TPA: amino acid adenylation domain-containing protein, partial [Herpetosiphonaceae bacterium]